MLDFWVYGTLCQIFHYKVYISYLLPDILFNYIMEKAFRDDLLMELNKFRKEPNSVVKRLELGKLGVSRMSNVAAFQKSLDELIARLKTLNALPTLKLSEGLCKTAEKTLDLVANNLYSANGRELETRLKGSVDNWNKVMCLADNGSEDPGDVITRLLLDKNDSQRNNSTTLLNPVYRWVGIALRTYDGTDKLVSIVFADHCDEFVVKKKQSKYRLTDDELTELKRAFDMYDVEGTGKINPSELRKTYQHLGFDRSREFYYDFIRSFESDSHIKDIGGLDYETLVYHVSEKYGDYESEAGMKSIFELFIDDRTRKVMTFENFVKLNEELGYFADQGQLKDLFERGSQNGKEMTFSDFYKVMSS
jgi:Ca2+-binding EF-hand superfamily protein